MKSFLSRRRVWIAAAAVVLLLFLVRPGAARLKARIAASISAGVGRQVEIGSVHIRLLPRPGFDLKNLVVHEDPVFGSEPMLRASEVTAALRLVSLMRGRLEIARLNLTDPSLNLVRGENGRWNLEALVERAQHAALAPTTKAKSEPRPGFPYIECSSGRINFKIGQEKKPYALTYADFALWQDSENTWGVRLEAQPFRSDLSLTDTGILRVNGAWKRAPSLRETPLQFSFEWDRPQLGQLTKFFTGADQGWRGAVRLDLALAGTPADLQATGDASVRDFRHYDTVSGDALRLGAHCVAQYSTIDHMLRDIDCRAPVGAGIIRVNGQAGTAASHGYDLTASAQGVPVSALVALVQRARKNLPNDLLADGTIGGKVVLRRASRGEKTVFEGTGKIANLRLASASNKAEFAPGNIPFTFSSAEEKEPDASRKASPAAREASISTSPAGPHIDIGPFPVALGRAKNCSARALANGFGYAVTLSGDAEVAHLARMARLFGLPAPKATAEGSAQLNLQIAGAWAGFASGSPSDEGRAAIAGTATLQNVRAEIHGIDGPLEISSADVRFLPEQVQVTKLSANLAHANWAGSLQIPRNCSGSASCLVRFELAASEVDLTKLGLALNPRPHPRPWYRLLEPAEQSSPSFLSTVHAEGKLTAGHVSIRTVTASHISAAVALANGELKISDLHADLLGGKYRGDWKLDFGVKPAAYSSTGEIDDIVLAQLSVGWKDTGVSGSASATYDLKAWGASAADFWQNANGHLQFDFREASLSHLFLTNEPYPLKISRFQGQAKVLDGKIEISDGQLHAPMAIYQVTGTASLHRELDLKLLRHTPATSPDTGHGYLITGTLAQPRVVPGPETQAKLKP
jgi:AsmA family